MTRSSNDKIKFTKRHNCRSVIIKYISYFFSTLGIFSFLYTQVISKTTSNLALVSVLLLFILVVLFYIYCGVVDFKDLKSRYEFQKTDSESINKYMTKLISNGSRVAIWTRDMSWANQMDVRKILLRKAKVNELIICLPKGTTLTGRLKKAGAEVYEYTEDLIRDPVSRFTITNYGTSTSSVAIGRTEKEKHIVEIFDSASHPAFHLAKELVDIAIKSCEASNGK